MPSVPFILPSTNRIFSVDSDTTMVDIPSVSPPRATSSRAGRRSITSEYTTPTASSSARGPPRAGRSMEAPRARTSIGESTATPPSHHRPQTQTPRARRREILRAIPSSTPSAAATPTHTYTRAAKPRRLYAAKRAPAAALRSALARRVSSLSSSMANLQIILPSSAFSFRLPPRPTPTATNSNCAPATHTDEATAMRTMLAALVAAKNQEAEEEERLRSVLGAGVVGGRSKFARVRVRRNDGVNVNVNEGGQGRGEGWMCGFEVRASA
ncbi:hypothetical protein C8R46DRAFT_1229602 [Mycena filopes]|nr:hypothetical protein C8R46DRAFT_1229602 [Mycena filopes]